jgi:adenosylmethionine-8-amino-7-oxononanoate aminotransferase
MCGKDKPVVEALGAFTINRGKRSIGLASSERRDVLHSWCVQASWDAPTVVGGAGARFVLEDGRSILDLSSQAECCNLGHQHPRVIAAIREQAERLCFVANAWGAAPRAELAARLLDLSGFEGGRVFFTLGGQRAGGQGCAAGLGQAARADCYA